MSSAFWIAAGLMFAAVVVGAKLLGRPAAAVAPATSSDVVEHAEPVAVGS